MTFSKRFTLYSLVVMLSAMPLAAIGQSAANYRIGPLDVLTINVFDQPTLGGKFAVEADGTFSFPLIGRVKAAGLTIRQFEDELRNRLADGYFRNPQVSVAIEQYRSQRIFLMGEVRNPGPIPLTGGMTLVEALTRAGSTLPSASGDIIVVRARQGNGSRDSGVLPTAADAAEVFRASIRELQTGSQKENIELQDGDTLYVPRAETAYVYGLVRSPGAYPIQKDTTVLQALSLAGGPTEHAATNRITIVRIVDGKTKEVRVKLTDIVQPGDTIKVPQRYF